MKSTNSLDITMRSFIRAQSDDVSSQEEAVSSRDAKDMAILGKKQQLARNFGFLSMLGFASTLMASWEALAILLEGGLQNGGPVALVYGFIFVFVGAMATCCSLAELASMAPTSGGQYHWVAQYSPPRWSAFLSWIAGWISVLAWQAVTASAALMAATIIQGLLVLNHEGYEPQQWHGTMLFAAVICVAVSVNVFAIRYLPQFEGLILVLHVVFFFLLLIPLVYLAPISSASFVFTEFRIFSGWTNPGVSWLVGASTSAYLFICFDGACHMSEEIQNAAVIVPKSMIWSMFLNGAMAFAFMIALLFGIGSLEEVMESSTGYPFIQIFYIATESKAATSAMTTAIISVAIFSTIGLLASASRTTWAFARDNGLPFARWLAHVSTERKIPVRAIILSTVLNLLLGLINIGSSTAFYALVSLAVVALYVSYMMPIVLLVMRRFKQQQPIQYGPWTMGRYGLFVNVFAIAYLTFTSIMLLFPVVQPVTAENMNYASVVFGGVVIISLVLWFVYGSKVYKGPVQNGA